MTDTPQQPPSEATADTGWRKVVVTLGFFVFDGVLVLVGNMPADTGLWAGVAVASAYLGANVLGYLKGGRGA